MNNQNPQNQLVPFRGFQLPRDDFFSQRADLRAIPLQREIDLSVPRSLAAGTALVCSMAGNLIYIDQKAASGYATVHFQDDVSVGNTGVTVYPGFLCEVPFTQLIIENVAQPGQVMRIIYGTDLAFRPVPSAAGVTVLNSLNIADLIAGNCQFILNSIGPGVGATITNLLPVASNVSGARIRSAALYTQPGAGGSVSSLLVAGPVAPVGFASLNPGILLLSNSNIVPGSGVTVQETTLSRTIPAGWGVWTIDVVAVAAGTRQAFISLEL